MIDNISQLDLSKKYTYDDYLTWQFSEMVELIRGKIFRMSPAPNMAHQWVSMELQTTIYQYLKKKPCRVFNAPFDVRLSLSPSHLTGKQIDTVVQPDISVICDLSKLDYHGCNGAPDWIIEILSKSTTQKDISEKFDLYQSVGVREYWIVHPIEETVIPYRMDEKGIYQLIRKTPFTNGELVPVGIFPDLKIDLSEVFVKGLDW